MSLYIAAKYMDDGTMYMYKMEDFYGWVTSCLYKL